MQLTCIFLVVFFSAEESLTSALRPLQLKLTAKPNTRVEIDPSDLGAYAIAFYKGPTFDPDRPVRVTYVSQPAVDSGGVRRQFYNDLFFQLVTENQFKLFQGTKDREIFHYDQTALGCGLFKATGCGFRVCSSDISPVVLEYIINSDLQEVCTWLRHNYLQINATKTQAMAIGPVNYRYTINLQDNNTELTDSLKILGVTLDERITFKTYIQEQLKKACAKSAALRKLCKFIPQDAMIRLYKAYVLPHLKYCSPLLMEISNGLQNKLEDTNHYILRTILRYSSSVFL